MIKSKFAIIFIFCFLIYGAQNLAGHSAVNANKNANDQISEPTPTKIAVRRGGGGLNRGGDRAMSRPDGFDGRSSGFDAGSRNFNRNQTSDFSTFKNSQPRSTNSGMMYSNRQNAVDFNQNTVNQANRENINRTNIDRDNVNRTNIDRDNINRTNVDRDNINRNNNNTYNRTNVNIDANGHYNNYNYNHYRNGGYWNGFYHGYHYNYPVAGIALGTFIGTLPLTVATIAAASEGGGETNYYYNEGVYYQKSGNGYVVTQPTPGVAVASIPDGFMPITYNDRRYLYYLGTFYLQDTPTSKYVVEEPPIGIVVPYIPDGAEDTEVNGTEVMKISNTYYLPREDNNTTVFEVVDPRSL